MTIQVDHETLATPSLMDIDNQLQLSWFLKVIYSFSTEGLPKCLYPEGPKAKGSKELSDWLRNLP